MNAEAARFREKLQFLPALWKLVCQSQNLRKVCRLQLVSRQSQNLDPTYSQEEFADTAVYLVHTSGPRQMPDSPEMKSAHEGWLYYNTCLSAAFVVDHMLQSLLQGDPDIEDVAWYSFEVRGSFVLLPDTSLEEGGFPFYWHEVIVLQGREGSYAIDLSAKQFGIQDWFFKMDDYEDYIICHRPNSRVRREERFEELGLPPDLRFTQPGSMEAMEEAWLMQFALDVCKWAHRIVRDPNGGPQRYPLDLSPYERKLAHAQIEKVFDAGMRRLSRSRTFDHDVQHYDMWADSFWLEVKTNGALLHAARLERELAELLSSRRLPHPPRPNL